MEEPSEMPVVPTFPINNVRTFSLFNLKDYNKIINQHNVKISKLMKLNFSSNAHPILLQKVTLNDLDVVSVDPASGVIPLDETVVKNVTPVSSSSSLPLSNSPLSPSNSATYIPDMKYCSFCKIGFCNQLEQRQHYKLDWHRYNIKLDIKQKPSVTEQQFAQIMTKNDDIDNDDVSSISGSESDDSSDSDTDSSPRRLPTQQKQTAEDLCSTGNKTRVLFENDKGNIVALYKCLFISGNKVDESGGQLTELQYINVFNKLPITLPNSKCLVVMLGGGHFAAAVFKGTEPILHKTFHSYTVRAKQGGSQSSKDNKRATNAKSAGASLRRYNEQSLLQHVQDILSSWSSEIGDCKYIFYRAVGPGNRSILFGGKQSALDKNDSRLCKIPFPTRRATFSEVKRAYSLLMSIYIYESEEVFSNIFQLSNINSNRQRCGDSPSLSPVKKKKERNNDSTINKTNRASKQRQSPSKDNHDTEISDIVNKLRLQSSDSEDGNKHEYKDSVNDTSISFGESLREFGNTPVPKKKRHQSKNQNSKSEEPVDGQPDDEVGDENKFKKKKRKKKSDKPQNSEGSKNPLINKLAKKVYLACFNGDIDSLKSVVNEYRDTVKEFQNDTEVSEEVENKNGLDTDNDISYAFNQVTQDGLTLLQNAAKNSQKDIVRFLLENGSDPCTRDKKSMTAYDFAPDKETRNVFRRFMGEFPDKYDYSKSHIPSPLTDSLEKEMLEKKRAIKKAKRVKEKEKRIADEPRRQEEAEKKRFLDLSDREKRALAAERRILAAVGKAADTLALVRCYQCAVNITGKVPFEYDNKVFCAMDCLKAHRLIAKKNQL